MVRRKKTTIFLDAKENTTVFDLKKMVEGITKVPPENQELYKDDEVLCFVLLTYVFSFPTFFLLYLNFN